MTSEERAEILVTGRLLEAAGKVDVLSTGLTIVAVAVLALGTSHRVALLWIAAAMGVVAKLFFVRLAFDARLLADVGTGTLDTPSLDHALGTLGLVPPKKAGRDWTARCRGAKRLVVWCTAATLAQMFALCFAASRAF